MNFCNLGVNRHRKLVNIGEEEESDMSSGVNFNAWVGGGGGVVCIAKHTYTHACMHTYIHIYTARSTSMLRAACALQNIHTHMHAQIYIYIHKWMHQ